MGKYGNFRNKAEYETWKVKMYMDAGGFESNLKFLINNKKRLLNLKKDTFKRVIRRNLNFDNEKIDWVYVKVTPLKREIKRVSREYKNFKF